jgi:hypothetical protein
VYIYKQIVYVNKSNYFGAHIKKKITHFSLISYYNQVTVNAARFGVACCELWLFPNESSGCCLGLHTGGEGNGPKSMSATPLSRFSALLFTDL